MPCFLPYNWLYIHLKVCVCYFEMEIKQILHVQCLTNLDPTSSEELKPLNRLQAIRAVTTHAHVPNTCLEYVEYVCKKNNIDTIKKCTH